MCSRTRVSDGKDMRYEIRGDWVDGDIDQPLAYARTARGAAQVVKSFESWPAVRNLKVLDKEPGKPVEESV